MKPIVPVSTIMTKNVVVLNINDSLSKAEDLFKKHKIRHIPIVSGKNVVGIISDSDLLKASLADYSDDETQITTTLYNMFTLEQVMTKNITTVVSFASVKEVAEIFAQNDFRALPVTYENQLVGIVTTTDIITYLLKHYE
ncbi:CBS domain-containing protein [Flavobacterium sp. xlx-214]|uniref:CBS domain-containing protein n=1 Tax=unclassified Flavobacterium TaxID=196869 RepID=UPI0013D2AD2A|nr:MULTISPECIES: CBS domain-containing protein [unclassified Flavobacterium]MBA5792314.1 CBS domain-containing protein [Flavobacterium sp. xlx-221]QMI82369.1 CBS domain-containing protein [Flavobacterium sp. xlx-214]